MIHEEKTEKWNKRDARDMFKNKSAIVDMPLRLEYGSSTHHPERKGGVTTCDIVLWCKWTDNEWFKPYGRFHKEQIINMIDICRNDQQVESLMEMLSCEPIK